MSPSLKNCYVVIYIAISINVVIVIVKGDDRERKQIDVYTDVSQLEQCASVVGKASSPRRKKKIFAVTWGGGGGPFHFQKERTK